jgi:carboxypeptidase family protein/TonB-dependent receptor-like protein
MRVWLAQLILGAVLCAASAAASAQTLGVTTGAINGIVSDQSDAVLPGVTVSVAGPSQMGVLTTVTDARGAYRFPGLPPGEYTLVFELAGFGGTRRERIEVAVGFTATVNVKLGLASIEEAVTVRSASPVVDASATRIQTNYTAERLASLPNARDIWSIMADSPAVRQAVVDVGGASAGSQSQFVTYGTRAQNQPMIEGMLMSQIGSAGGSVTFYYDYGSFQEVSVNAAGNSADMAMPGVQFQFISKSGGNDLHGSALANYENEGLQSYNIDARQLAQGVASTSDNRLHQFYDRNADVGGPIERDRLWWYTSFRDERSQARYANFPVQPFETRLTNFTGKLTYQPSSADKLIVYGQGGKKHQPYRQDAALIGGPGGSRSFALFSSADATANQKYYGWVWKAEYDRTLTSHAFAEIRAGRVGYTWNSGVYSDETRREDLGNLQVSGGNVLWVENVNRNQVLGSLSLFESGRAGAHTVKTGFELYRDTQERNQTGYPGNILLEFNNGAATAVREFQPSFSINRLFAFGLYVTDAWNIGPRLNLNAGVRLDHYRSYLPAQARPASEFATAASFPAIDDVTTWNLPAPRVGLTYKLDDAGKTVVKANAGRYWWNPDVNVAASVNSNIATAFARYAWSDPNGDRIFQPSEQGRLLSRTGGSGLALDPNLKNTYTNELATWLDHELLPNFELRTGMVWRGQRQLSQTMNVAQPFSAFALPVQVRDPGPDGRVGTTDDGPLLTLYNLDPAYLGQVNNLVTNVPIENDYYTWELTGNRRMINGWSLMASYTITWNRENMSSPGAAANPVRSANAPVNPNDLVNASDDGRYHYALWNIKLHAVIPGPWQLQFSPLLRSQSGQPFGRTFVAALNYGSQRILAEPLGAQRQDAVTIVDARVERVFHLPGASRRASAQLDFYNLLNANPEDFIAWGSGSSYLRPSSVVAPRIVRFGVKVDW